MPRLLLIALLFVKTIAIAQPNLLNNYSIYDSCPDPVKYHIASRTIFRLDSGWKTKETRTEYFDHQGRLVTLLDEDRGSEENAKPDRMTHFYSYNDRGYVKSDSGVYDSIAGVKSMHYMIEYQYLPDHVVERFDHFGDSSVTVSYYDKHNRITREYIIDKNKDTVYSSRSPGDTTLTLHYVRLSDSSFITADSTIAIATPGKVTSCSWLNYIAYGIYREQQLYNRKGQLIEEKTWLDDTLLRERTVYIYKHKRLIHSINTIYPHNYTPEDTAITNWYADYTYDRHGRLITLIEWSDKHPDQFYFSRYTYNSKGLPTGVRETMTDANGREVLRREEVWTYEYY